MSTTASSSDYQFFGTVGGKVVVTHKDDRLCVLDGVTLEVLCQLLDVADVTAVAVWSPGTGSLDDKCDLWVVATVKDLVRCWRVYAASGCRDAQEEWMYINRNVRLYYEVCISLDGQWAAAGGYHDNCCDGEITVFSLRTDATGAGAAASTTDTHPIRTITCRELCCVCFGPDGHLLLGCRGGKLLHVWSVESGEEVQHVEVDTEVNRMALRQCVGVDGTAFEVVTGHVDGSIRLLSLCGAAADASHQQWYIGEEVRRFSHGTWISAVHCTSNGRYAITGAGVPEDDDSGQGTVGVFYISVYFATMILTLRFLFTNVLVLTVRIWDLESGQMLTKMDGHTGVGDVGVLCNGNVVGIGWDGTLFIWQPEVDLRRALVGIAPTDQL